jgi:hypothetical protein
VISQNTAAGVDAVLDIFEVRSDEYIESVLPATVTAKRVPVGAAHALVEETTKSMVWRLGTDHLN